MKASLSLLALLFVALSSCRKDEPVDLVRHASGAAKGSSVELVFSVKLNSEQLLLGSEKTYTNSTPGDTFSVDRLDLYVSNIRLKTIDGYTHIEPESYRLLRCSDSASLRFTITGMHEGDYRAVEFLIGVDSARNVSGAQAGFLDPAWNMFWGWSSGYIFFKLEGDFTSLSSAETLPYNMHIGGFSGPDQCIRKCALAFPKDLQIRKNRFAQIKIEAELDRLFDAVENIDLTSYNGVTIGKKAAAIASNYQKMFSVKEVSNQ